jgi:hypothetical protein
MLSSFSTLIIIYDGRPEGISNREDYKSKNKASGSASNTARTTDFDS